MAEQIDELVEPLLRKLDQQASGVAEVRIFGVQDICSEQASEVDDELFGRWHETKRKRPQHLVRVELLMKLALQDCIIAVLEHHVSECIVGALLTENART